MAEDVFIGGLRVRAQAAAQSWAPGCSVRSVEPLTGGASSLTFVAELADAPVDRVVLKVAPPGLPPVRNRDVLRQSRLMRGLAGQPGVVVPPVYFDADAVSLDQPPLLAMGFVIGECIEPALVEREPSRFAEFHEGGLDLARVLAAVHRVDPGACGLGDEPVVTLGEEIDRWTRAFGTVAEDLQGNYRRAADALHATMPAPLPPSINHGDYRLGNTLCHEGRLTAIIDWEIWSIGDPRVDLTWMTFFTDESQHPGSPSSDPCGMPSTSELLDAYVAAGGVPLVDMAWFEALTRYKETAATALLIKRGRKAPGGLAPSMGRMVPALPKMLDEVHELLGR